MSFKLLNPDSKSARLGVMSDVFISYAREDMDSVRELVAALEHHGFSVFWDRDTAIGEEFELRIENALAEAKCVVVVWSASSIRSRWVRGEAHEGLDRNILIPVRLDESKLPLPFRGLEAAYIGDWPDRMRRIEFQKLFDAIRLLVEHPESHQSPQPVRDDPSISIRVAERVVSALEEDRGNQHEVETVLTDSAFAMLKGGSAHTVTRSFLERLALVLSCEVVAMRSVDGLVERVVDAKEGVDDETLNELLSLSPGTDGVRLFFFGEVGIDLPDATWGLRIDSTRSAEVVLLCINQALPPSPGIVGRLKYATQFLTLDE